MREYKTVNTVRDVGAKYTIINVSFIIGLQLTYRTLKYFSLSLSLRQLEK